MTIHETEVNTMFFRVSGFRFVARVADRKHSLSIHSTIESVLMRKMTLPLASVRTDIGTQMRAAENPKTVAEYVEALERGNEFPPITVFQVGKDYILVDGFHRVAAYRKRGLDPVSCLVEQGTLDDAREFACCANQGHGLQRSSADKRNAVERFFAIPGRDVLTNSEVARRLGVTVPFVQKVRDQLGVKASPASHMGAGAAKTQLNGLKKDNGKEVETGLNRLMKSEADDKTINIDLPLQSVHKFALVLTEKIEMKYLKSCVEYLDGILRS